MSRKDLKAKPVSVYLPLAIYEKLQSKADRETRTMSQTITFIITEHFKHQPTKE